jgi:hypothetical protein
MLAITFFLTGMIIPVLRSGSLPALTHLGEGSGNNTNLETCPIKSPGLRNLIPEN